MVRVDGTTTSNPIDWMNDLDAPDAVVNPQDVNFNGSTDPPSAPAFNDMQGFNDLVNFDLRQIGARFNAFGFSGGGIGANQGGIGVNQGGIGANQGGIGANQGGIGANQGGIGVNQGGIGANQGGIGANQGGVGTEQDRDMANSTVDHPNGLTAVEPANAHFVNLNWIKPGFGQIRIYYIWRADTTNGPISKTNLPKKIGTIGTATATTPPMPLFFQDPNVKNGVTYTYFVTAALGKDSGPNNGNQSGPSNTRTITINFSKGATGQ